MRRHGIVFVTLIGCSVAAALAQETTDTDTLQDTGLKREQMAAMSLPELKREIQTRIDADDYEAAAALVTEALGRGDGGADLELTLLNAETQLGLGDLLAARFAFQDVLAADRNDYRANVGLGEVYLSGNRPHFRQAITYLERARTLAGTNAQRVKALRLLGEAYLGAHQPSAAVSVVEDALRLDSTDFNAILVATRAYAASGAFDRSIEAARILEERAKELWQQSPGEIEAVERLIIAANSAIAAIRNRTRELFERGPAGEPTDKALPGREDDIAGLLMEIVELQRMSIEANRLLRLHDTLTLAERAVEYDPDQAEGWVLYGNLLRETYQDAAARAAYAKALEVDPENRAAQTSLRQLSGGVDEQDAPAPGEASPLSGE